MLVAITLTVTALPASAAPEIDIDQVQDPAQGDLITFRVDGSQGYDGAVAIAFRGCGNREFGVPIPLTDPQTACVGDLPGTLIGDGSEFAGLGILVGLIDGVDYDLTLRWREHPFLTPYSCGDGFEQCRLFAQGIRADLSVAWELTVPFNDVDVPTITPGNIVVDESGRAEVPVTLSRAVPWNVNFTVNVHDLEAMVSTGYDIERPFDFPESRRVHNGDESTIVDIGIRDDQLDELDERFVVSISDVTGAKIGGFYGLSFVTILDNDPVPELTPIHTTVREGNDGTTTAKVGWQLSEPSGRDIEIGYTVFGAEGATSGTDFVPQSGTVMIPTGATAAFLDIEVIGDRDFEATELVAAVATSVDGGKFRGYDVLAIAALENDDPAVDCDAIIGPGADLEWCDFSGQVLDGIDLRGANLRNANFNDALLARMDFRGADLTGATIDGTVFFGGQTAGAEFATTGAAIFAFTDLDDTRLEGNFAGSSFSGVSARNASFVGEFDNTSFAQSDLSNADLSYGHFPFATFGQTTCPDGEGAADTGDTCLRLRVQYRSYSWTGYSNEFVVGGPWPDRTVYALLFAGPRFSPGFMYYGSEYRFGPTGNEAEMSTQWGTCGSDWDNDGWFCDVGWHVEIEDAELPIGTSFPCVSGTSTDGQKVWGCAEIVLTDFDAPPISPPVSPPNSPPSSPPISPGAGGGLVDFLAGPIGLTATAAGVGLVFMWGSTLSAAEIQGSRRDDEDDVEVDTR